MNTALAAEQECVPDVFVWSAKYETGIEIVDTQHHGLVDLINRIGTVHREAAPVSVLEQVLDELAAYARDHFATEHRLMHEAGLDQAYVSDHVATHGSFVKQLGLMRGFLQEFAAGAVARPVALPDHLARRAYSGRRPGHGLAGAVGRRRHVGRGSKGLGQRQGQPRSRCAGGGDASHVCGTRAAKRGNRADQCPAARARAPARTRAARTRHLQCGPGAAGRSANRRGL
ncbi:MAG: hemerythrin domain-containing protein [Sterolibacteriaceae bacterium]|nr:hemerythrin domain-containing protein [Sterolibacteriaceae bacterium]